jgi:hypothetical protein
MDALEALLGAFKSAGNCDTEGTTLALRNYIDEYDLFIATCNDVETKRQEETFNSNSVPWGLRPTPDLNRALSELREYSESGAQHEDGDHIMEELNRAMSPVSAHQNIAAPEETMKDNLDVPEGDGGEQHD